jgi:predicted SAM-dependent methyltransferase
MRLRQATTILQLLDIRTRRPRRFVVAVARIQSRLLTGRKIRIIAGSSGTRQSGWIATEKEFFDLTSRESMSRFLGRAKIDRLLLEHVLEHLTEDEVSAFLREVSTLLEPDALIRIAVPDAYHPSPWYRAEMGVGGREPGAEDHKTFWSVDSLSSIAVNNGFKVEPIEYFDGRGIFHSRFYDEDDGYVARSSRRYVGRLTLDSQLRSELFAGMDLSVAQDMKDGNLTYTSLIADLSHNVVETSGAT